MMAVTRWWATLVSMYFGDKSFKTSRRVYWHLKWTAAFMKLRHPKWRIHIMQATFSHYELSAGTHDKDMAFDIKVLNAGNTINDWYRVQTFLRFCGWAAWFRHTGSWSDKDDWHIHMISIPTGLPANPSEAQIRDRLNRLGMQYGTLIPRQLRGYYKHTLALKNQDDPGDDHSQFPNNINATVFLQSARTRKYRDKYPGELPRR